MDFRSEDERFEIHPQSGANGNETVVHIGALAGTFVVHEHSIVLRGSCRSQPPKAVSHHPIQIVIFLQQFLCDRKCALLKRIRRRLSRPFPVIRKVLPCFRIAQQKYLVLYIVSPVRIPALVILRLSVVHGCRQDRRLFRAVEGRFQELPVQPRPQRARLPSYSGELLIVRFRVQRVPGKQ